jgi:hypothetical protein
MSSVLVTILIVHAVFIKQQLNFTSLEIMTVVN